MLGEPVRRAAGAILLIMLVAPSARAGTSCPLTTRVHPFAASESARYDITIADGSGADLDGQLNGVCEVDFGLCNGDAELCDAGTDALRLRSHTVGLTDAARLDADERITRIVDDLSAGQS